MSPIYGCVSIGWVNVYIDVVMQIFLCIRLFERGLAYVGTDYLSYSLWDKYIEYEEMHAQWSHVAMIYTRILEIPNKRLDDYLTR